jgi:hypothetical protein
VLASEGGGVHAEDFVSQHRVPVLLGKLPEGRRNCLPLFLFDHPILGAGNVL